MTRHNPPDNNVAKCCDSPPNAWPAHVSRSRLKAGCCMVSAVFGAGSVTALVFGTLECAAGSMRLSRLRERNRVTRILRRTGPKTTSAIDQDQYLKILSKLLFQYCEHTPNTDQYNKRVASAYDATSIISMAVANPDLSAMLSSKLFRFVRIMHYPHEPSKASSRRQKCCQKSRVYPKRLKNDCGCPPHAFSWSPLR